MGKKAMPGQDAAKKKRYSFSRAVSEEGDAEWRGWFEHIARLRKESTDKRSGIVFSTYEKDGKETRLVRNRTDPARLTKFIKKDAKKTDRNLHDDFSLVENAWASAVGAEIAAESAIFSFKNGILTVSLYSQTLLQEIRQFHQEAILKDLQDIWQASMPLVKIIYKPGKR